MSLVHFPDIMGSIPAKIALLYFLLCHLRHLLIADPNSGKKISVNVGWTARAPGASVN